MAWSRPMINAPANYDINAFNWYMYIGLCSSTVDNLQGVQPIPLETQLL